MATTTESGVRQTYKDYCATPDDERYELLDGKLMMVPAPNTKHQRLVVRLIRELKEFAEEQDLGTVYVAPCDVFLTDTNVVQPDVLFISRSREHRVTAKDVRGAPDLVIEILSPSTAENDEGPKRELFGRHGVLEYWIVDPIAETIAVHRQEAGKLERAETLGRGETLRTAVLDGLQPKVDDVFRV